MFGVLAVERIADFLIKIKITTQIFDPTQFRKKIDASKLERATLRLGLSQVTHAYDLGYFMAEMSRCRRATASDALFLNTCSVTNLSYRGAPSWFTFTASSRAEVQQEVKEHMAAD